MEAVWSYCCATQVMTMNDNSPSALSRPSSVRQGRHGSADAREWMHVLVPVLLALAAFAVYWRSAALLDGRSTTALFGADSPHDEYLRRSAINHRAARFHPLTVVLGLGWMKLLAPATAWVTPAVLLNAFFAAVGAIGVWASTVTFATLLPRRQAILGGVL